MFSHSVWSTSTSPLQLHTNKQTHAHRHTIKTRPQSIRTPHPRVSNQLQRVRQTSLQCVIWREDWVLQHVYNLLLKHRASRGNTSTGNIHQRYSTGVTVDMNTSASRHWEKCSLWYWRLLHYRTISLQRTQGLNPSLWVTGCCVTASGVKITTQKKFIPLKKR